MNLQQLVKLHKDCGCKIHEVYGYNFYHYWFSGGFYPLNCPFPSNYHICIDKRLVNALKWRFMVTSVLLNVQKKDLYEFILTTDNYELDKFDRKVRNRIKKSLQTCIFIRPSLEDLLSDGLLINRQSCEKQSRKEKLITDQKLWGRYITSIYNNNEFIIWGAYFEGKLTGYLIIYELEGKFNMLQALINRTNSSVTNPMCGLIYTAVNSLIKEYGRITISYGIHQYRSIDNLNKFKQKMLFEMVPLSRGHIINPLLLTFVKLTVFIIIRMLHKKNVKYKWLRKILSLYQGHRRLLMELKSSQIPELRTDRFQPAASSYSISA